MLTLIGLGLGNEKDISINGLEKIKQADIVYLEYYTSILECEIEELEKFYDKKINICSRQDVEGDNNKILEDAKTKNVVLLVIGDVFSATTHTDIFMRAKKENINVDVIYNASILTAIGIVGLQLYKYGKTTSIVYPEDNYFPKTAFEVVKKNKENGLHTLCLLDIKMDQKRFMTVNEGLELLQKMDENKEIFNDDLLVVGCSRLGHSEFKIKSGKLFDIKKIDFGKNPHCIIIPGKLHFMEEEMLEMWK